MLFSDHVTAASRPAARLRSRWIFKELLQLPLPEAAEKIPAEASLLMWSGDLLERIGLLSEQIQLVLSAVRPNIHFAMEPNSSYQLVILDGRYLAYSSALTILDLESGDVLEKMPHTALESVAYNLGELYRRRLQGGPHAEAAPGSLVEA